MPDGESLAGGQPADGGQTRAGHKDGEVTNGGNNHRYESILSVNRLCKAIESYQAIARTRVGDQNNGVDSRFLCTGLSILMNKGCCCLV